ncbi:MAG: AI-2E family transporter [Patescibacteria group bacterium]
MEIDKRPININIITWTIVKIIIILLLLYFLFLVHVILAILFISLVLSCAIDPWVGWMQKKKIPRSVGILIIYLSLFLFISLIIYLIVPPITEQVSELINNFPRYSEKIISIFSALKKYSIQYGILNQVKSSLDAVNSGLQVMAGGIFSTISNIFNGFFAFFLILVLTFYIEVEENFVKKAVWLFAPKKKQAYIINLINRIQKKIGLWLRGQMILCLVIFVLSYIGLTILNVKYALILALIAGLTEFIPYLGPILGAIPAIFLAFTQAPLLGLFVFLLYFIIQQSENHILVPKIMEKAVGIHPVISIVVLIIGFKVAGVAGALLAIPVTVVLGVLIKDILDNKNGENEIMEEN